MLRLPRHRRLATWLTLLVWLLATLAPGVSRAAAHWRGDATPWSEICSVSSVQRQDQAPASDAAHQLEHCKFCSLQHADLAAPPAAIEMALAAASAIAVPRLLLQAPRLLFAWGPAQSRAPPQRA
ncbi:MAG: DUF2946 family protein [Burkholderiales bacterium]|nr:DUF2946 family protein [Burkholderiales bacterium]